jgi:diaminopimelate epimerase
MAGYLDPEVLVHLVGGDLKIKYDETSGHAYMTGPAVSVFTGDFPES